LETQLQKCCMETSIYINNNPGNIKYFADGGIEGVDYYLGKSDTGIKYKKFNCNLRYSL